VRARPPYASEAAARPGEGEEWPRRPRPGGQSGQRQHLSLTARPPIEEGREPRRSRSPAGRPGTRAQTLAHLDVPIHLLADRQRVTVVRRAGRLAAPSRQRQVAARSAKTPKWSLAQAPLIGSSKARPQSAMSSVAPCVPQRMRMWSMRRPWSWLPGIGSHGLLRDRTCACGAGTVALEGATWSGTARPPSKAPPPGTGRVASTERSLKLSKTFSLCQPGSSPLLETQEKPSGRALPYSGHPRV
jgi:hypothetical protein